jgi:hypothetical protein
MTKFFSEGRVISHSPAFSSLHSIPSCSSHPSYELPRGNSPVLWFLCLLFPFKGKKQSNLCQGTISDLRRKILTGAMTDSDGVQERGTWRQQKLSPSHYFLSDIVSESLFPIRSHRKCTPLSPCQGLRNPLPGSEVDRVQNFSPGSYFNYS